MRLSRLLAAVQLLGLPLSDGLAPDIEQDFVVIHVAYKAGDPEGDARPEARRGLRAAQVRRGGGGREEGREEEAVRHVEHWGVKRRAGGEREGSGRGVRENGWRYVVRRKASGEVSSITIQDLMPSTERALSGVANLPKGASYTKATGPSKAKPQRNHCLVTVYAWSRWASQGRTWQSERRAYLYTDTQSRTASLERDTLPSPLQRS